MACRENAAMGITVAYAPTKTNRLILSKIRPLPMLDGICFAPLPDRQAERVEIIKSMPLEIRGRTLFLWGDGKTHDESYFFSARPLNDGVGRLKINLDPHSDEYMSLGGGDGLDFETMKPKRGNLSLISFANHMSCTEADGVEIFTSERLNKGSIFSLLFMEMADFIIQKTTKQGMMRFVHAALEKAISFDGEVDVTLDLDLIRGIPVLEEFMMNHDSVNADSFLIVLEATLRHVSFFDVGGLVDSIPDFNLIDNISLRKSPKESDVLTLIASSKDSGLAGLNQSILDSVGSYAAMFIANVIRIFAESREWNS